MLHSVAVARTPDAAVDVIFVHGLDGDHRATWQMKGRNDLYWPQMLGERFENANVWSLEFDAASLRWKGQTMPLVDRAANVLALLATEEIGTRPIIFVCHSLGGLLVKQALRHASSFGEQSWRQVYDNTRGIVFLATPNSGSSIASFLSYVRAVGRSASVIDLERNAPALRDLNLWFRAAVVNHADLRVMVLYEKRPTFGLLVVDESSADPGISGVIPVPMDDDHLSICKPQSADSLNFKLVAKFVREIVISASKSSVCPSPDSERLRGYWMIFDRPAFREAVAFEANLHHAAGALADVSAAMATGRILNREGAPLRDVEPISAFEDSATREQLARVRDMLGPVQRTISQLSECLVPDARTPRERWKWGHLEFHLQGLIAAGASRQQIQDIFALMDEIDDGRNRVIAAMNVLFRQGSLPPLPLITLSSDLVRLSATAIEEFDWSRCYLRTHAALSTILSDAVGPDGQP